jgi:hypothetical protein
MTWFETLTGFPEESPQQVRENITVDRKALASQSGLVEIANRLQASSESELDTATVTTHRHTVEYTSDAQ